MHGRCDVRPTVTFPAIERHRPLAGTKLYCLVTEAHGCEQLSYSCIGLSRYIATATLAIIAVFLEYLGQFLIDLHQIYRHSSVPKNMSPCNF